MGYTPDASYGRALLNSVAAQIPSFGRILVVMSSSDTASENYSRMLDVMKTDTDGKVHFFNTLELAYAAAESNNNDVICLDGHSTHSLAAGIAWTKSRVHLMGFDGGDRLVQQGAKVQLGGAITTAYVIKVTGVRNSFRNIKFIQGSTASQALTVLQEGGEGNLYKNCTFTFGVVDNLGGTTAHEVLAGSDSATFLNCSFGTETLLTSGARSVFHIDQVTSSQEFKSNVVRDCIFLISSSSSTATFIRLDAVGDILFSNLFERCSMIASVDSAGGAAIANAVQTGTGTVKGGLYFAYPSVFNVTDFSVATNGWNANVQIVAPESVAAAVEGIKPTA